MSKVIIYQPTKNAMQSGRGKVGVWKLEYERNTPMTPDPLMGWNTMADTKLELHLHFDSKDEAVAYAKAKGLDYEVVEPKQARIKPKAYAENFTHNRRAAYDKKVNES